MNTDRMMEQVHRLVSSIGHKRAIEEVAGQRYDERTDSFVPDAELAHALTERYNAEMTEFVDRGGY